MVCRSISFVWRDLNGQRQRVSDTTLSNAASRGNGATTISRKLNVVIGAAQASDRAKAVNLAANCEASGHAATACAALGE